MQTDFDLKTDGEGEAKKEVPPAKDIDGIPYCRDHHCRMKQSSGGKKGSPTVYYRCPVKGCECKQQVIKTKVESIVPQSPLTCPRCKTNESVCVRDPDASDQSKVVLKCPVCKWKSNALATPQFANLRFREYRPSRQSIPDVGER